MFKIGCHLSASKGYVHMAKEILSIGGNTFQFFTRNPRGGTAKEIDKNDIERFNTMARENGIEVILAHAPYTINVCSADEKIRRFGIETMKDDILRLDLVSNCMYNFHPGSHVGQGVDTGIQLIIDALNEIISKEQRTIVLLETMAGKGSEVGRSFEEIKKIIDGVKIKEKIGVCLDTCHVYDAGYDLVNNLDGVLDEFDKIIGLDRLKAIHINDSKNPFESHKDRHEKIGDGTLGTEAFEKIINNSRLKELPFYLETPNELDGYEKEIKLLKELRID
ncbi:MAG: deoxyribonuclease IV [Clostridia bacterium]|nr:deoxyribonuclease IV [Clostridia bacterium]